MKKKPKEWRFSAERIYLTYARTLPRFRPKVVLKYLEKIVEKYDILQYLISIEDHADGGKHIHAYLKFDRTLDSKNVRFMDIKYYGKIYHPNVQSVTGWHKLMEYIKKDGDWISNIEETRPMWKVIAEDSLDEEDFATRMLWHFGTENNYLTYRLMKDVWSARRHKQFDAPKTENKRGAMRGKFKKDN